MLLNTNTIRGRKKNGYNLKKLYDHVTIQINDTHPSMIIPELIRLLGIESNTNT